jgi:hypothetical protein
VDVSKKNIVFLNFLFMWAKNYAPAYSQFARAGVCLLKESFVGSDCKINK